MAGSPQHAVLVANQVMTLTFDVDFVRIEVLSVDGADVIYGTVDGTAPVIGAIGTFILPAAIGAVELTPRTMGVAHTGPTVVKLISPGTPTVSVRGL